MYVRVGTKSITPEGSVYLLGHAIRTENSIGIADEIEVNSLVIENGVDTFIWISVELVGMEANAVQKIRSEISKKYGVSEKHIMYSVTHTHAAPNYKAIIDEDKETPSDYYTYLMQQVLDSVEDAYTKDKIACEPFIACMQVDGLYSNRNGLEYYYDPTLTAIKWIDENNKVWGGIINFNCHATVLGPQNLEVSGDLFGYIRRKVAKEWGVNPLVLQSSSGDVSNRMHRQGNDYQELTRVGDALYSQMQKKLNYHKIDLTLLNETVYHYEDHYTVPIEIHKKNIKQVIYNIEHAENYDIKKIFTSSHAYLERLISNNITEFDVSFDCYIYHYKDVIICTIPAELNSILGKVIKEARNDKPVLIWGYCNDSIGYIVEETMHGKTYEGLASRVRKGKAEIMVAEIAEIIKEM